MKTTFTFAALALALAIGTASTHAGPPTFGRIPSGSFGRPAPRQPSFAPRLQSVPAPARPAARPPITHLSGQRSLPLQPAIGGPSKFAPRAGALGSAGTSGSQSGLRPSIGRLPTNNLGTGRTNPSANNGQRGSRPGTNLTGSLPGTNPAVGLPRNLDGISLRGRGGSTGRSPADLVGSRPPNPANGNLTGGRLPGDTTVRTPLPGVPRVKGPVTLPGFDGIADVADRPEQTPPGGGNSTPLPGRPRVNGPVELPGFEGIADVADRPDRTPPGGGDQPPAAGGDQTPPMDTDQPAPGDVPPVDQTPPADQAPPPAEEVPPVLEEPAPVEQPSPGIVIDVQIPLPGDGFVPGSAAPVEVPVEVPIEVPAPVEVPVETEKAGTSDADAAAEKMDLELADVRLVDAGDESRGMGPRYRLTYKNAGSTDIEKFHVTVAVDAGDKLTETAEMVTVEAVGVRAGKSQSIDVRLPVAAMKMGTGKDGQPARFVMLAAIADSDDRLAESDEENNLLIFAREEIKSVSEEASPEKK